jgi:hypothetical protein
LRVYFQQFAASLGLPEGKIEAALAPYIGSS